MPRFEVIEVTRGETRVITTTRRENGAIAERDIAADSCWRNLRKHAETGGAAVWADHESDPRATTVTYVDADATLTYVYSYRRIGGDPEPEPDLTDALLASLMLVTSGSL